MDWVGLDWVRFVWNGVRVSKNIIIGFEALETCPLLCILNIAIQLLC